MLNQWVRASRLVVVGFHRLVSGVVLTFQRRAGHGCQEFLVFRAVRAVLVVVLAHHWEYGVVLQYHGLAGRVCQVSLVYLVGLVVLVVVLGFRL